MSGRVSEWLMRVGSRAHKKLLLDLIIIAMEALWGWRHLDS